MQSTACAATCCADKNDNVWRVQEVHFKKYDVVGITMTYKRYYEMYISAVTTDIKHTTFDVEYIVDRPNDEDEDEDDDYNGVIFRAADLDTIKTWMKNKNLTPPPLRQYDISYFTLPNIVDTVNEIMAELCADDENLACTFKRAGDDAADGDDDA